MAREYVISKYAQKWRDRLNNTESGKIAVVLYDIQARRIDPVPGKFGREWKVDLNFDEENTQLTVCQEPYCWVVFRTFLPDQVRDYYKSIPDIIVDLGDVDKIADILDMVPWSSL